MIPMMLGRSLKKAARITMHHPSVQITPVNVNLAKSKLNIQEQRTTVNSNKTKRRPLVTRNFARSFLSLDFCKYKNALVPAKKTKAGAQK